MKIKSIKATGDYVVLKVVKTKIEDTKKTKSGIILPNQPNAAAETNVNGERVVAAFYVDSIGPVVDITKYGFKKGDEVIANQYDLQYMGTPDDEDSLYALCKAESIKCVVESER